MNDTPTRAPVAAVIVLAAGGGTRMKSRLSKLLHTIAGRPMLSYALDAARALQPERLVVVVGHLREQVEAHLAESAPQAIIAEQPVRNGTGGAVACGLAALGDLDGVVAVTYGDVPLLSGETLSLLVDQHVADGNACTVLTAVVPDPTGYGRIVREGGEVARIVEHRDATEAERAIAEINSGIYVFDARVLREGLSSLQPDNAQSELYLTDVLGYARAHGGRVGAVRTDDAWQTEGVNDRVQLAAVSAEVNRRLLEHWMREGVTIADPSTTWIEAEADLSADVTILPNTQLLGATSVATGAVIGPDTTLRDCEVGENAHVIRTHGELSIIGEDAEVGPFARLRPGTVLGARGKIGTFVEAKNAHIGDGSKVPHLTYCGDAWIGEGVNVGAGTIFANYDGKHKSPTHLGDNVFIGSNSVLVAPVDVADGAFVAAGSAVVDDVPPGALAVARGRQHISDGWVAKRRPGSKAAQSAAESSGQVHQAVEQAREKLAREQEDHQ
ncbi:bifunctional UDP-N-acetylglucosamine diphosphorylase/glucosamine-1-phosphate N-acetyltransferase GlmU [Brooklawnia cerclae]|uniref:Bifunctional protein GlmU n=2 Tax=Brooklawnia cerclae TaxID=349934 RepID=A0ABX0SM97_9ACTN|nr:bifunctional UDP-N-acetylglucosamine pyrophosphorylase/glucosamine-1-phosphate N-acetyltransferase [Brooklawnia cerclae]